MNRKNTRYSSILAITLQSLLILGTMFVCGMIFAYGLFFKGTPKGDGSLLLAIFEALQFYTLLIAVVMISFFTFMIVYALRVYKLATLPPLEYKLKEAYIKIYNILNSFCYIVVTTLILLLCFAGAFESSIISILVVFLGVSFVLLFVSIYLIKSDTISNNKDVKHDSVSNIKTSNFNQKYGLGEYAKKQPPTTPPTQNKNLK